jgi:thiamine-monophosphate kinase
MRLSQAGELSLLEKIRDGFPDRARAVITGIGDDSAVLRSGPGKLLATSDMMVEGVHFDLGLITPRQLGFKLISANVSDIYAMGGRPRFALLDIAATGDTGTDFIDGLLSGVKEALGLYGVSLVGGDVSSSGAGMALSATLLGFADRPVRRSGARPGDMIYVTGSLGESACGLGLLRSIGRPVDLEKGRNKPLGWDVMRPLLKRHLMPEARRPGALSKHATSMIDLSDGLFLDLTRLCAESGVGARIYEDRIPVSEETRAAAESMGLEPMRLATAGGEDYELLFTAPTGRKLKAACIGEVTRGGLVFVDKRGVEAPLRPEGYRHFG